MKSPQLKDRCLSEILEDRQREKNSYEDKDGKPVVFVLWQSLVVSTYRSFFAKLVERGDLRLALAAPARFRELASQEVDCAAFAPPFSGSDGDFPHFVLKAWRPHVQIVWFFGLRRALWQFFRKTPKSCHRIFLCVAEPYSLTALFAWLTARSVLGRDFLFICYAAQNIYKPLPKLLGGAQSLIFANSASILVVGREQEEVLRRHGYLGKTTAFPLWFDSDKFHAFPPLDTKKLQIGYAGGLTAAKGVLDLLGCCETYKDAWKARCELVLAGAGPLEAEVAATCRALQAEGFEAQFLGSLGAEAMPDFYRGLDLLIVPSRTTANWKEQFGRVIIEAQACGVVVLGSQSGEIPHVIGASEQIFPEGDTVAMGKLINSWVARLENPQIRAKYKEDAAKTALSSYSDKALAGRFAAALSEILRNAKI